VLGGGIRAYGWVTILLYCLWLNKHTHFSIGYGPTPPSFNLTTGKKLSHKVIKLVEELLLGFLAGAVTEALPLGLLAGAVAKTLKLLPNTL
jgi:hypothetical protein